MKSNNHPNNLNDDRLKEYLRQQERLKAMAANADKIKPVSADVMIENLLKQSFKKPTQPVVTSEKSNQSSIDFPVWLQCDSSMVPAPYKNLWALVQANAEFADTQKVSQLLLTSGLHTDVLGYIWNLANKMVPGKLTKQEFYIVLALVGLAQTGCTFNNLNIFNLIPTAPIPVLQVKIFERTLEKTNVSSFSAESKLNELQDSQAIRKSTSFENNLAYAEPKKYSEEFFSSSTLKSDIYMNLFHSSGSKKEQIAVNDRTEIDFLNKDSKLESPKSVLDNSTRAYRNSNFPLIGSSPTAELEMDDDFTDFQSVQINQLETSNKSTTSNFSNQSDDFTDFQSADISKIDPLETVVISQKKEVPKIPLPKNLAGKLTNLKTNILKISPESERKLKILSQPDSLSSLPESKISSSNKVSTMPGIAVISSGNRGIGSRLANHSLSTKVDKPKHQKHHKIKPIINNLDDILAKPPNVEELFPKCYQKNPNGSKTFLLKETKIRSIDTMESPTLDSDLEQVVKNTRRIEIPMLGTFNETTLPTQIKTEPPPLLPPPSQTIDLISVKEDKYSVFREIDLELQNQIPTEPVAEQVDDFGDFLSADLSPPPPAKATTPPIMETVVTPPKPATPLIMENVIAWPPPKPPTPPTVEKSDEWGEWNFKSEPLPELVPKLTEHASTIDHLFDVAGLDQGPKQTENEFDSPAFNFNSDLLDLDLNVDSGSNKIFVEAVNEPQKNYEIGTIDKIDLITSESKSMHLDLNESDNDFKDFLSCELKPPVMDTLSRHSSLPSLELKISPSEETEVETIWRKCLETCFNLLQEGYEIFSGVSPKWVLDEVFSTEEAADYLNNLSIAYHISKRISQNSNEISSIQEDIDKIWEKLQRYCFEYNIKLKEDEDSISGLGNQCNVCFGYISSDQIEQGSTCYHPSCANLWINCIEGILPCSA